MRVTEKQKERMRKYYIAHREEIKARSRRWIQMHPIRKRRQARIWAGKNKEKIRANVVLTRRRYKDECFMAYGGYICNCCGTKIKQFLTIDHIEGGGRKQRIARNNASLYWWLRKHKFPRGYQVLCMNCNWGKHINNGTCPHVLLKKGNKTRRIAA